MVAARFNRTAIMELLIAHGANPNARDANGVTAGDAAARMGAGDAQARLKELGGS
jgi:ankyrin repeat protein